MEQLMFLGPRIGRVKTAGLTTPGIERILQRRGRVLKWEYGRPDRKERSKPQFVVVPRDASSYFIDGLVARPGYYHLSPEHPLTLRDVLDRAGFDASQVRHVDFIHGGRKLRVWKSELVDSKTANSGLKLAPGDIVFVELP